MAESENIAKPQVDTSNPPPRWITEQVDEEQNGQHKKDENLGQEGQQIQSSSLGSVNAVDASKTAVGSELENQWKATDKKKVSFKEPSGQDEVLGQEQGQDQVQEQEQQVSQGDERNISRAQEFLATPAAKSVSDMNRKREFLQSKGLTNEQIDKAITSNSSITSTQLGAPSSSATSSQQQGPNTGTGPALPPRNYPQGRPLPPVTFVQPPKPRDYRTLVKFFTYLTRLLIWTGVLSSGFYVLFRSFLLPRLRDRYNRLGLIYKRQDQTFANLLASLRVLGSSDKTLLPRSFEKTGSATQIESTNTADDEKKDTINTITEIEEGQDEQVQRTVQDDEEVVPQKEYPRPIKPQLSELNSQLTSLVEQIKSLPGLTKYSDEEEQDTTKNENEDSDDEQEDPIERYMNYESGLPKFKRPKTSNPQTLLLYSLQDLSNDISTQNYSAVSTLTERSMKLPTAFGNKADAKDPSSADLAANEFRKEIRGMKGLLLNRRNFSMLDRNIKRT